MRIWKCMEGSFKNITADTENMPVTAWSTLPQERDSNYLMNAILCSLELRESMKNLSNNWKMTKGWFNELPFERWNQRRPGIFRTIPHRRQSNLRHLAIRSIMRFDYSILCLLRFNLDDKESYEPLSDEERKQIFYGIRRKEQNYDFMIENIFSRCGRSYTRKVPNTVNTWILQL